MIYYDWEPDKNERLKNEREIGFENILEAVHAGKTFAVIPNPKTHFSHQKILIVEIDDYAYTVPYVQEDEKIFLKTIMPSRKATQKYIINKRQKKTL